MVSYMWSIWRNRLSHTVFEILRFKDIGVTSLTYRVHVTSSVTWPLDSQLAMCGFILVVNMNRRCISHRWDIELQRFWGHDLHLLGSRDHWTPGIQNRGKSHRILALNESVLTFWAPNFCAKFHPNRTKTATVGGQKDESDFIICPMLCYSNRTDKQKTVAKPSVTQRATIMSILRNPLDSQNSWAPDY